MVENQEQNTVVQETTNAEEPTKAVETQENVEVEAEDGEEATIEFDDSDTAEEEESNEDKKKKPSRDKEREYAKKRREQREREIKDSYFKGVKTAIGDYNPYTNEKMETDEDIQTYLDMKEMEKKGLDPTNSTDYIKFMREKTKLEAEQKQLEEKVNTKMNTEIAEFKAKYPNVDINALISTDANWNKAILPQVAQGRTLLEAYEAVNALIQERVQTEANNLADEKAKKQVQNTLASTGSLTDGEEPLTSGNTVNIRQMSNEQFKEYWKNKYGG